MSPRIGAVLSVFRSAFGNPALRRIGCGYALFVSAEFGIWIALLIFAYGHGGASASTLIVLVQLIPCIVLGPFLGAFVDRRRPSSVLRVGYGLQAASLAAIAAAIGLGAPPWVVFVLAALSAISLTMTRSPQAAILPAIVRTADELTAANALTGWTDGAASLVGPALVGVLTAVSGLTAAVAATSVMSFVALVLTAGLAGPAPAVRSPQSNSDGTSDGEDGGGSIWAGAGGNLVAAARNPQIRVLLTLHTFYFVVVGSLDLLCVILAVDFLHMGPGGAGFLNAAFGAGALFAVFFTAFLVGRRHLSRTLTAGPVGRRHRPGPHRSDPEGRPGPFPHCLRGSRRRGLRHHRPDIAATICATRGDCRYVFDSRVAHGFRSRHGRHRGPHCTGDRWHPGSARGPGRLCGGSHRGAVATAAGISTRRPPSLRWRSSSCARSPCLRLFQRLRSRAWRDNFCRSRCPGALS